MVASCNLHPIHNLTKAKCWRASFCEHFCWKQLPGRVWTLVHRFRGACFLACPPALGRPPPLVWRPLSSGCFMVPTPQRLRHPLWSSSFPLCQLLAEPHFWHVHWAGLRDSRDWRRFTWSLHRGEAEDRGSPSPGLRWGRKRWALRAFWGQPSRLIAASTMLGVGPLRAEAQKLKSSLRLECSDITLVSRVLVSGF